MFRALHNFCFLLCRDAVLASLARVSQVETRNSTAAPT